MGDKCSCCGGPFHPATGHEFGGKGRFCGPCTRDFFKWVRGISGRRWGKVNFYKHAFPPPAIDTSAEDLAE